MMDNANAGFRESRGKVIPTDRKMIQPGDPFKDGSVFGKS